MSSQGLFIWQGDDQGVPVGAKVESVLEWPVLLDGEVGLKLVTIGRVVRSGQRGFAVEFKSHQFRTAKKRNRSAKRSIVEPSLSDAMNQIFGVSNEYCPEDLPPFRLEKSL